jgi:hypothetical protein
VSYINDAGIQQGMCHTLRGRSRRDPAYFDVLVGSINESSVEAVVTGIHNVEMIIPED